MKKNSFEKGLHKISQQTYAYLQPDGSWGLNNTGLIIGKNQTLLIDTLFDYRLTEQMLRQIKQETGLERFDYLVNTHANGDHYYGNGIVNKTDVIATVRCANEMPLLSPRKMNFLMQVWWLLGEGGRYIKTAFQSFEFKNIPLALPNKTFSGQLNLDLGDKKIELIEVKDAHSSSDLLVYIPDEKILFASDLLFVNGIPLVWTRSLKNWLNACEMIMEMKVNTIIPGHGPITNKNGIKKMRNYLQYIDQEARKRINRNMSILETALDIDLKEFREWGEPERIVTAIHAVFLELNPALRPYSALKLFALMQKYKKAVQKNRLKR